VLLASKRVFIPKCQRLFVAICFALSVAIFPEPFYVHGVSKTKATRAYQPRIVCNAGGIAVRRLSSIYIEAVLLKNGVRVLWNGRSTLHVTVPSTLKGNNLSTLKGINSLVRKCYPYANKR